MRWSRFLIASLVLWMHAAVADTSLTVVSSIKPLQMLVTAIGGEDVDSRLLLAPGFSPHDARLKPSQWKALKEADLVVWVGPELEQFLAGSLRDASKVLALGSVVGSEVERDPHIWLNVNLVADIATQLARTLADRQPRHEAGFLSRAARLVSELRQEDLLLRQRFLPNFPPYLLPHRGYTHFERQYGLVPAAVVSLDGDHLPGAAHILALRERVQAGEFACVFREPQHDGKLMARLLEGVEIRQIALDPMGSDTALSGGAFVEYYRALAEAFLTCAA